MVTSTETVGSMALGVNNRLPATQLSRALPDRSRATFLSVGDNIDITGRGYLRRRRGYALELPGPGVHSVWGDGDEGYCAVGADLVHLKAAGEGLARTVAIAGLPLLAALSYARMPDGDVAWSNGQTIGRLRGAVALPLITPRPPVVPVVTLAQGALDPGRYQVAFTQIQNGLESASTIPLQLDVPEGGSIAFPGLAAGVRVYVTGPNGSVFNHVAVVDEIVSLNNTGAELRTLLLADMPPGQIVRWYLGSLLVASGSALVFSEPFMPGLRNPSRGYIPFPAPITVVEPCDGGVYVCADRTYWLAGPLLDTQPVVVLEYSGLLGSGSRVPVTDGAPGTAQVVWLSPRGLVLGGRDGTVTPVQEKALKFGPARAGATLYREQDGADHILTSRQEAVRAFAAARGFYPADDQRKETAP